MRRTASLSADGQYRWDLGRQWDMARDGTVRTMAWIMLNPSTANHVQDDATITRCINFADDWGFHALRVYNLFAVRMTKPTGLKLHDDPIGAENAAYLRQAHKYDLVVAAWGAHQAARLLFKLQNQPHAAEVVDALRGLRLHCLGTTTDGHPKHPLYLAKSTPLQPWPA